MTKFLHESWLVLVLGVVFAALLAGTQTSLEARIQANRVRALQGAIAEVVPEVARTEKLEVAGATVYRCLSASDALSGWAVDTSGTGFVDRIRVVVGLAPDTHTITGIKVIENVETPGLGNKIEGGWAAQFRGRDAGHALRVVKGAAGGGDVIQAITGATYSSTYVTDIVNDVIARIRPELEQRR